jgi:undecaprenyl-diphosphatase
MIWERFSRFDALWSQRLRRFEQPGWTRNLAILFAHSGDSWFWLSGLGLTWLLGSTDLRRWALHMILSIFALAFTVMVIKFALRRPRPEGEFGEIYRRSDPHSFPSGHAARSMLLAVLSLGWGPPWLSWILVPWAPLVSLARVALGLHYPTDVLAGAFLGILGGVLAILIIPLF